MKEENNNLIIVNLPKELLSKIDKIVEKDLSNRSQIVRTMVKHYFDNLDVKE